MTIIIRYWQYLGVSPRRHLSQWASVPPGVQLFRHLKESHASHARTSCSFATCPLMSLVRPSEAGTEAHSPALVPLTVKCVRGYFGLSRKFVYFPLFLSSEA